MKAPAAFPGKRLNAKAATAAAAAVAAGVPGCAVPNPLPPPPPPPPPRGQAAEEAVPALSSRARFFFVLFRTFDLQACQHTRFSCRGRIDTEEERPGR